MLNHAVISFPLPLPMGDFDEEGAAPGGPGSKCCPGGDGYAWLLGPGASCRVSPGISGGHIGCAASGKLSPGDSCHPGEPICPPALGQLGAPQA